MDFFISLFSSAFLLIVTNGIARSGTRNAIGAACTVAGLGAFFGLFWSPLFPLQALLVALAGLLCLIKPRPWLFLKTSLAATAVAFAIPIGLAIPELREWARLKEVYPFESMTSRLAYETRPQEGHSKIPPETATSPVPTKQTSTDGTLNVPHLEKVEEEIKHGSNWKFWEIKVRTESLKEVHAGVVQQFVDSPGFGIGRRIFRPSPSRVNLPEYEPIPLPPPAYEDPSQPAGDPEARQPSRPGQANSAKNRLDDTVLQEMHDEDLVDFVNSRGFGYIKDREHVAGFQPHQFQSSPQNRAPERWLIQNLELVSLLKHEEPAVYLSEHFPRMDELRQAPTRPLDPFEAEALADLRRGQDLKVQQTSQRLRMVGSIRAVQQCLDCHQAQRGDLLGAFSYKLRLEPADPK